MSSVKIIGGLMRGWGMFEIQGFVWFMLIFVCVGVNNFMQNLMGVKYYMSE